MSSARNPEEVLASIRRLVAREVSSAQERESAERPPRDSMPLISARASAAAAARHVMRPGQALAANGAPADAGPVRPVVRAEQRPVPTEPLKLGSRYRSTDEDAPGPEAAAPAGVLGSLTETQLRDMIREILREEVRTRMGARINANIQRIVQSELAQLFPDKFE